MTSLEHGSGHLHAFQIVEMTHGTILKSLDLFLDTLSEPDILTFINFTNEDTWWRLIEDYWKNSDIADTVFRDTQRQSWRHDQWNTGTKTDIPDYFPVYRTFLIKEDVNNPLVYVFLILYWYRKVTSNRWSTMIEFWVKIFEASR